MVLDSHIKVIIFDFDGTLFHLSVDWQELKTELGLSTSSISLGEALQAYIGNNHPNLEKVTQAELHSVEGKQLSENIVDVLNSLGQSYKLAIFTRNSRLVVEKVLVNSKFEKDIYIVGREDTSRLKPDPEGLHKILLNFKASPEAAVLVGDTYHDVEVAKTTGLISIVVNNPFLELKPKNANFYIETITDLPAIIQKIEKGR